MTLKGRPVWIAAAAAALILPLGYSGAAGKGIPWQNNLKKATAQAAKQKKLVMVDFSAPW